MAEKRSELGEQVSKLRNGLFKIDETRSKVEAMSVELEDAKKKVAEFQKQCEEYLVVIVQQKREADEQQKVIGRPQTILCASVCDYIHAGVFISVLLPYHFVNDSLHVWHGFQNLNEWVVCLCVPLVAYRPWLLTVRRLQQKR